MHMSRHIHKYVYTYMYMYACIYGSHTCKFSNGVHARTSICMYILYASMYMCITYFVHKMSVQCLNLLVNVVGVPQFRQ